MTVLTQQPKTTQTNLTLTTTPKVVTTHQETDNNGQTWKVTTLEPQNLWGDNGMWGMKGMSELETMVYGGKTPQQPGSDHPWFVNQGMDNRVYTDRDYRYVYGNTLGDV